ncbi:hypothetical protein Trihar35433_3752 [Trichoderma harzianum]|nr:hypothetical protein Trihar35433_3752 [Trichoderma harzianum]
MASSGRNYDRGARFQRLLRRDPMRTGYVLVSEERESGSEYSGSTCCCSSCASSSCSSSESSDDEDDDDDDAYLSDCSACWARRDALRRGRAGWREEGDGGERRAEERDRARQDYRHHNHRHRHGETRQRGGQQSNGGNSSRNNNGSPNVNTNNTTATPAYRSLTERILASTRRLHQEEENRRHFRSWMRVLEDVQRRSHTTYRSNSNSNSNAAPVTAAAAAAVAVGQGSSSSAAAVGRVPPRAGAGEEAPVRRRTHVYSYPPRAAARGYFMSGGRSISSNRRRRL